MHAGFTSCVELSVTLLEGQSAFATCVTPTFNDIVEVRFCPICTEDVLNSSQCVRELSITNETYCHRHGSLYFQFNGDRVVEFSIYNASIEDSNTTIACLHINTDNPVMPDLSSACLIVMTSGKCDVIIQKLFLILIFECMSYITYVMIITLIKSVLRRVWNYNT